MRLILNSICILTIAAGFTPAFGQVTLMASPNPATLGAPVALQASVPGGAGKVTFFDGVKPLGTAVLAGGQATLTTRLLPAGTRTLKAVHIGSFGNPKSVSPSISVTINAKTLAGLQWVQGSRIALGGPPLATVIADVNNDGFPDFGTVTNTSVAAGLGKGDGSILPPVNFSTTAGNTPAALALADFDLDGKSDAALQDSLPQPGAFCPALGNAQGGFKFVVNNCTGLPGIPNSEVAADFNGDGLPDVAVATNAGIVVFLGNGDGTFQQPSLLLPNTDTRFIAAADFRGNGTTDLVFVSGMNVEVMLGNGNGTFQPAINALGGNGIAALVVGNFKPGKFADVALINSLPANNPPISRIYVLLGNGDGTLQQPGIAEPIEGVVNPVALAVGDFNGDGKLDLVVTADGLGQNPSPPFIQVGYGNGDGTFTPGGFTVPSVVLSHPTSLAVTDLNGDGLPDLVIASQNSNEMVVLLGTISASQTPLAVSPPGPLSFTGTVSQPPAPVALSVTSGGTPVSFTVAVASNGGSWLSASPTSGTTPGQVMVSVDPSKVAGPGMYTGSVTISSPSTNPPSVTVQVTLTVPPPLAVSPPGPLSFTGTVSQPPAPVALSVTSGGVPVSFTVAVASNGGSWLLASPSSGTTPGQVMVSVDPSKVAGPGMYTGSVTISSPSTTPPSVTVQVTLTVPPPQPTLAVSPAGPLAFTGFVGLPAPDPVTLSVTSGGTPVSFTVATAGGSWLSTNITSGTTPGQVLVSVDPSKTNGPGVYNGSVTISSPSTAPPSVTVQVTLTIPQPGTLVNLPASLTFTASGQGGNALSQVIALIPSNQLPLAFTASASSANSFLAVSPVSGGAPSLLTVTATPGSLAAGTYQGTITLSPSAQKTIPVTLIIPAALPVSLSLTPPNPQVTVRAHSNFQASTQLLLTNGGGGAQPFSIAVPNPPSWLMSVFPLSGTVPANGPAPIQITVNPSALDTGTYTAELRVTLGALAPRSITVTAVVTGAPQAVLSVGAGVSFTATRGEGLTFTQTVPVLDLGENSLNWTAGKNVIGGQDWLVLKDTSPTVGSANRVVPGQLTLSVNPAFLASAPVGTYYAQAVVNARDSVTGKTADNSGRMLGAVLQVLDGSLPTTVPMPLLDKTGVIFRVQDQTVNPPSPTPPNPTQTVQVFVSSAASQQFQVFAQSETGNWLRAVASSPTVSTNAPVTVTITAITAPLPRGVYRGSVSVVLGSELRTISVKLIVTGGTLKGNAPQPEVDVPCNPSQLAVEFVNGVPGGFSSFVAGPQFIVVQVRDDCGNLINDPGVEASDPSGAMAQPASVVITFDSGDPSSKVMDALSGASNGLPGGLYGTTWTPTSTGPTRITVTATLTTPQGILSTGLPPPGNSPSPAAAEPAAAALPAGIAQIGGKVLAGNTGPVPIVARQGELNNSNPKVGDPLAPGTVVAIYGLNLATSDKEPGVVPLLTTFNGATVTFTGLDKSGIPLKVLAPFYFVGKNQVNVQLPYSLVPGLSYDVVVSANGVPSVPDRVSIVAATPGLATFGDGTLIGQHALTGNQLITDANPAQLGELITIYLVGLGATTPAVKEGDPPPAATANAPVSVTVGGVAVDPSKILYAGLSPGSPGLYQINVYIPPNALPANVSSARVPFLVTAGGVPSNTASLPVKR